MLCPKSWNFAEMGLGILKKVLEFFVCWKSVGHLVSIEVRDLVYLPKVYIISVMLIVIVDIKQS